MDKELQKIVEQMIAAGESEENIALVIQQYNSKSVAVPEKKNPIETGESDANAGSLDSDAQKTGDGLSDSSGGDKPKSTFRKYLEWIGSAQQGTPYFGEKTETMKALESGTARMVGGLVGLPDKLVKADLAVKMELAKMFGSDEVKKQTQEIQDKINSLPEKQRTEAKLKLQASTVPAKKIFGVDVSPVNQWFADRADEIKDAQETIDSTRKQYEGNIVDDIGSGNIGQASERIFNGIVESVPMLLTTVGTGGAGLAAIGTSVGSDKMEDLEREGEMSDIEMLGVGTLRGGFEALGGKVLQGIFKPAMGKVSRETAESLTKSVFDRLKTAAKNFGKEAAEEASQSLQEEITDALVKGEDIDWGKAMKNMVDAGLIGGFSTAPSNIIQAPEGGTRPLDVPAENVAPETDSAVELERIKSLPIESEDGATLNLDGSKYEGGGLVVPIASQNFTSEEFSPEKVQEFIDANKGKIGADNVKVGYYKFPNQDQISVDLNIVVDPQYKDTALEFGKQAGQESLFDLDTFENIKTGADGATPVNFTDEQFSAISKALSEGKIPDVFVPTGDSDTNQQPQNIEAPSEFEQDVLDEIDTKKNEGLDNDQIVDSFEDAEKKRTAEILLKRQADIDMSIEEAAEQSKRFAKQARTEAQEENKSELTTAEQTANNVMDKFVDRQASVKTSLKQAGMENVVDFMVSKLGASAAAKFRATEANNKIFKGLSEEQHDALEEIILLKRTIDIDKNRSERNLPPVKHQGNMTSISAAKALEGYRESMSEQEFEDLNKRSDVFFDEYKSLLLDMKNEGLISEETYETFAEVNYQPRQFLKFLKDMDGNFVANELDQFEGTGLSSEQIKSLNGGSESMQLMDSQLMLNRSIFSRTKAMFNNRLNRAFAEELPKAMETLENLKKKKNLSKQEKKQLRYLRELEKSIKVDEIVGFSENTGKPKYKLEKARKTGFKPIYYYKDGVPHRIYMKESLHSKFTDTGNQIFNAQTRQNLQTFTGTNLVKTMATGENPLFLATNIPRDIAFALVVSPELSNNVAVEFFKVSGQFLKNGAQLTAGKKSDLYKKYIEYGGGMDFLTVQGREASRQIAKNKTVEKAINLVSGLKNTKLANVGKFLRNMNQASEVATRLVIFDRSIKNRLKEKGVDNISDLSKKEQDQIYIEAVRSARELTDFNQGGTVTKAGDAIVPYLNAATQGTRSFLSKGFENPKRSAETIARIAQASAISTAVFFGMAMMMINLNKDDEEEGIDVYFDTLKGISEYDKRNYFIIPDGTKDKNGERGYLRIAKAQALTPFINATEYMFREQVKQYANIEYDQDLSKEIGGAIYHNLIPLELNPADAITRIPAVDASYGWNGWDAYTDQPLDYKKGEIPVQLEGKYDTRVEDFYKEFGELFGASPVRSKAVVESIVTTPSTNPYLGLIYTGLDAVTGNINDEGLDKFVRNATKRFKKNTAEYNRIRQLQDKVSKEVIEAYDKHMRMENDVRKAVREAKRSDDPKVLISELEKVYKEDDLMLDKALKWGKSEYNKKKVTPLVNTLRFEKNKEVRAIILSQVYGDALVRENAKFEEREQKILEQLIENNVIDKETYDFYKRLVKK